MSGGIAYVLDADGTFASRVNTEMVDVVALNADDHDWLGDTLRKHRDYTGSAVAERLLAAPATWATSVRKVMPRDYARVLRVIEAARSEGCTDDETSRRIMESVRG
jgi:glutamate synthase (NADPH/NADH) large chain